MNPYFALARVTSLRTCSAFVMLGLDCGPPLFFLRPAMLFIEHAQFSAPGASSLLAAYFGDPLRFGGEVPLLFGLDLIQQDPSR
jgi:hypothetical protein